MTTKTLTKKQWKREIALRNALAVARVADIAISDAYIVLDTFKRYERKLQRLAELECNGYPKPVTEYREGKRYEYSVEDETLKAKCLKSEGKLMHKVMELAQAHKLVAEFPGDPRGLMFRLTYEGQEVNYWGE
jgi:hypothetical protein